MVSHFSIDMLGFFSIFLIHKYNFLKTMCYFFNGKMCIISPVASTLNFSTA